MNDSESAKRRVGVIGADGFEVACLRETMTVSACHTIAGMEFCEGFFGDLPAVIAQCGIGKVNAGICAQILIGRFGADRIINTGVAGSLNNEIDIGDLVISTDAVQHDFDISPLGYRHGEIPYLGLVAFPADEELRALAAETARRCAPELGVFEGRVCSGDQFIVGQAQKDLILERYGGMCCEMEGAAVAQVCRLNGVPWVVIRAISDKADGSSNVDYPVFAEKAARDCAEIVRAMIARIGGS